VIVVPDRTAYQPDSTGLVILQVTLINAGSTDATSSTCYFPGASGVAWRTEKWLNEAWRLIYDAGVNGCAPPSFQTFTLASGERKTVTAHLTALGGQYRIGVTFVRDGKPWYSQWSRPLEVTR
jgi:hypothetical protein